MVLEQLVSPNSQVLQVPPDFISEEDPDLLGEPPEKRGTEESGVDLSLRTKLHHGGQQLAGPPVAELRHVENLLRHLHNGELVRQQESLFQPLEGLHRRRLRHEVGDEGEGVVGQRVRRVHKLLALRNDTGHLKIKLRSGKPQDRVAGPEVREFAAPLITRLQRRLLLHIHEILQEGIVGKKIHDACSGSPIVEDRMRCDHVECRYWTDFILILLAHFPTKQFTDLLCTILSITRCRYTAPL